MPRAQFSAKTNETESESKKSIVRIDRNLRKHFTILSNIPLEIPTLSWKAKGLWAYLMSRPDDWVISVAHLTSNFQGGKDMIWNTFRELQKHGLCTWEKERDAKGRILRSIYTIHEVPIKEEVVEKESPHPENPCLDNPSLGNPHLPKTDIIPKTDSLPKTTPLTPQSSEAAANAAVPAKAGGEGGESFPQSVKKTVQPFDETVLSISRQLIELLKSANSDYRAPRNMGPFLNQVDVMINKQKLEPKRICEVMAWALADNEERDGFTGWSDKMYKQNPAKYLCDKFPQLSKASLAQPKKKDRQFAPSSDDKKALQNLKDMDKRAL